MGMAAMLAAAAMTAVLTLGGCGGGAQGTFNKPTTQTSTNSNGMVVVLDLAKLSENINYVSSEDSLEIPTIDSLDVWTTVKQDADSAGQAFTYKMAELSDKAPSFEAAAYDADSTLKEARVFWDTSSANSGQATFEKYSIALIRSVAGVDYDTAASMYSIAHSTQYTNGVSQSITYAYSGNIRCYYMINGGYHMLVVEPFSTEVQTADVATGKVVYTAVGAAGSTSTTTGTSTGTSAGTTDASGTGTSGTTSGSDSSSSSSSSSSGTGTDASSSTSGTSSSSTSTSSDSSSSNSGNVSVKTTN